MRDDDERQRLHIIGERRHQVIHQAIYKAIRYCRVADKKVWVNALQKLFSLTEAEAETLYRWIRGGASQDVCVSYNGDITTVTLKERNHNGS